MDFASAIGGMAADAALIDEQKPSLFELLSEQQLNGLLPPTLRYLLTVLTQRYPRYLLRALNSFDELYALGMLVVEHYYLRTRGGTFTEHFYGLKREQVLQTGGEVPRAAAGTPDSIRQFLQLSSPSSAAPLWKNLAIVIGVPYLKRKLDEAYELDAPRARLGAAFQQLPANPTWRDRIRHYARWFLRHVYPSVHAAYGFAVLAFHLAYLFDGTRYANPLLWLVGTRIRRMTGADYKAIDDAEEQLKNHSPEKRSIGGRVLGSLSLVLPASIFALKFLEWWHASDFAKQLSHKATAHLDLPAPIVTGLPAAGPPTGATGATAKPTGIKGILKKDGRTGDRPVTPVTPAPAAPTTPEAAGASSSSSGDEEDLALSAPIAKPSLLPILTVPSPSDSSLCPICGDEITAPTACQTGVVYCYTCIHKWVAGQHDRQESFLADKAGRWESGIGRCAVTGRRVLGGTEGLRRLMV